MNYNQNLCTSCVEKQIIYSLDSVTMIFRLIQLNTIELFWDLNNLFPKIIY